MSHRDNTRQGRIPDRPSTLLLIITLVPSGIGRFEARLDGNERVLCLSRTPFFDAARKLLTEGNDPHATLIMRHAGSETESLRAKLGIAALLTVEETDFGPKFRRWKAMPTLAVEPSITSGERAATVLARVRNSVSIDDPRANCPEVPSSATAMIPNNTDGEDNATLALTIVSDGVRRAQRRGE